MRHIYVMYKYFVQEVYYAFQQEKNRGERKKKL